MAMWLDVGTQLAVSSETTKIAGAPSHIESDRNFSLMAHHATCNSFQICQATVVRVLIHRPAPKSHIFRGAAAFSTALAFFKPRAARWRSATRAMAAAPAADVVIFSRPGCGFCARAKALLSRRQVRFGVVDVGAEPERLEEVAQRANGVKTFPQILVGSRCLGGKEGKQRPTSQLT